MRKYLILSFVTILLLTQFSCTKTENSVSNEDSNDNLKTTELETTVTKIEKNSIRENLIDSNTDSIIFIKNNQCQGYHFGKRSGEIYIPSDVKKMDNIKAVYTSGIIYIAHREDKSIYIWKDETLDEINPKYKNIHKNILDIPDECKNKDISQVDIGLDFVSVLKEDGTVCAWGQNEEGQCDIPSSTKDVKEISVGIDHTLVLKTDGTVIAWGDNKNGKCNVPPNLKSVVSVSAGRTHSVALLKNGDVVTWGEENNLFKTKNAKKISAGSEHTLVVDNNNNIEAFPVEDFQEFEPNTSLENIQEIYAGDIAPIALKEDGSLVFWKELFEYDKSIFDFEKLNLFD